MEKKIKMGIVGAGTWGRTHAYIYREHSNAEPVAICDMNRERAQAIADEFGIKEVYTDYHEMAEKADIDAVAIVTPDFAHADIACCFADHKRHLLIEKPLATTREDAERIVDVEWVNTASTQFLATICVKAHDRDSLLLDVGVLLFQKLQLMCQ